MSITDSDAIKSLKRGIKVQKEESKSRLPRISMESSKGNSSEDSTQPTKRIGKRKRKLPRPKNDTEQQTPIELLENTSSSPTDPRNIEIDKLSQRSYHPNYPIPTGHYQKHLHNRLKSDQDNIYFPLLPLTNTPHIIGGLRDLIQTKKQCNCKRSHCLKLYCECFASGVYCDPNECHCTHCKNREFVGKGNYDYSEERAKAVYVTLERNPSAFRPRFLSVAGGGVVAAWNQGNNSIGTNNNNRSDPMSSQSQQINKTERLQQSPNTNEIKQGGGIISNQKNADQNQSLNRSKLQTNDIISNQPQSISSSSQLFSKSNSNSGNNMRGCNCRKSFCLKKYCECFQAAVYCSPPICRCTDCQNVYGNELREKLIAARRDKEALSAAAAAAVVAKEGGMLNHVGASGGPGAGPGISASNSIMMMNMMGSGSKVGGVSGAMMMGNMGLAGLPPSSFAVPMQLDKTLDVNMNMDMVYRLGNMDNSKALSGARNSLMIPPIAFETVGKNSVRNSITENEVRKNTLPQSLNYSQQHTVQPPRRSMLSSETSLQKKWRKITESDLSYLENIRDHILNKKTTVNTHSTTSKIETTIAKIENAMKKAKIKAIENWEKERQLKERSTILDPSNNAIPTKDPQHSSNEESLECEERLPETTHSTLSEYAAKEFAILEAQEAAMLFELAAAIKEDAFSLAMERKNREREKLKRSFRRSHFERTAAAPPFPTLSSIHEDITKKKGKAYGEQQE